MSDLFLQLINMSISASWLVLAVVAVRFLLKRAPKWITCCLWAMVAVRLICPFSLESALSLIPREISSGEVVKDVVGTYVEDHNIYQNTTDQYQAAVDAGREPVYFGNGHSYVVTGPDGISEPATVETSVVPILSNLWLAGIAVMLLYAVVSYLGLRRKVAASICLRENIYICDYISSPFILGILRPRIYLPSSMDQIQWPHVLAHEKAHIRRRDHWWKPLGFLLLSLHWFNPILWLAYILLCRDIELACDEKVIRELGSSEKKAYSEALLECSVSRPMIAACPLAFGEVGVKERVKSVLNYKKPAFWIIVAALIVCAAVAVCFLTDPVDETDMIGFAFDADVLEVSESRILVRPSIDSTEIRSASRIWVTLPEDSPEIVVGNTVRIVYDGLIMESYPAQISGVRSIEVIGTAKTPLEELPSDYTLEQAISDGCVVMMDGDVAVGQAIWQEFVDAVYSGEPASVRYVNYYTIGDPDRMSDDLFESHRDDYPVLYVHDLSFNGGSYTSRYIENGKMVLKTWKYLMHYTGKPDSPNAIFDSYDRYVLTDRNDVSYEQLMNGMYSADFRDQIPFESVYDDLIFDDEPTLADLNATKDALTPYMETYQIAKLEVNEVTGRLDIWLLGWTDGLYDLIEQYINPHFANVTELIRAKSEVVRYPNIELAILDGCVAVINSDIVARETVWQHFLADVENGTPSKVRIVRCQAISYPDSYAEETRNQFPSLTVIDLVYDGNTFTRYWYEDQDSGVDSWQYLLHFTPEDTGSLLSSISAPYEVFVLTNGKDVTYEACIRGAATGITADDIEFRSLFANTHYANQPTQAELETVMDALTEYMHEYHMTYLDANELTQRLDIGVSQWDDGLAELIARYIDLDFVTIREFPPITLE